MVKKQSYKSDLETLGCSYLGGTRTSMKVEKSYQHGVETYILYLAPWKLASDKNHNINVCPYGIHCKDFCLNESGHNKLELVSKKEHRIQNARIRKTQLFYDDRETFMRLLIHEITRGINHAKSKGLGFAVRLNGTSDLSPLLFVYKGRNILDMFPNVQFYDYTKVPNRIGLMKLYRNYHVTLSYDGHNMDECKAFLSKGGNVAMVFDITDKRNRQILPKEYMGFEVEDANNDDMRYLAKEGTIQGLHYHRVAKDYKSGKYVPRETPFVIR